MDSVINPVDRRRRENIGASKWSQVTTLSREWMGDWSIWQLNRKRDRQWEKKIRDDTIATAISFNLYRFLSEFIFTLEEWYFHSISIKLLGITPTTVYAWWNIIVKFYLTWKNEWIELQMKKYVKESEKEELCGRVWEREEVRWWGTHWDMGDSLGISWGERKGGGPD